MSAADESLSLAEAVTHLLEECRMILPGVQALFGFQLIAVFDSSFAERLSPLEQRRKVLISRPTIGRTSAERPCPRRVPQA
jgi:hypothetical protein